jgi:hypothetical protein
MKCEDERLNPTPNATRMANLKLLSQIKNADYYREIEVAEARVQIARESKAYTRP